MHAIIFDVDGTLTQSTAVDATCYERAVFEVLGIHIETDWTTYRHQTDEGILSEVMDRHGVSERLSRRDAVRSRFIELLAAALRADASACRTVPGACEILARWSEHLDVALAIATGGWEESARIKLRCAGIESEPIAFASSDDSPSRQEIIRVALRRAAERCNCEFESATYIGDAPWDVRAASELGIDFVGVAVTEDDRERLVSAGAQSVLSNFADSRAIELAVPQVVWLTHDRMMDNRHARSRGS